MCGRMTLEFDIDTMQSIIKDIFEVDSIKLDQYEPSYNLAPTNHLVSVIEHDHHKRVGLLQWGLLPSWAKDERMGYKMINARGETIHEKPSYKEAFEKRRCIIVASGFYEWRQSDKQPYHISLENQFLMLMAGIWSRYKTADRSLYTCSIVTTKANEAMSDIHHRMPLILNQAESDQWLQETTNIGVIKKLMKPYSGDMYMRQVSKYVNSVKNNGPECMLAP